MWKHKYLCSFNVGLQSALEYRSDFIIGITSAAFPIIIQVYMWTSIYGNSDTTVLFNRSYGQMISYAVIAAIVSRLIRAGFEYEVNEDIKNGGLSKYIVRPVSYLPYRMCCFLGQKAGYLVVGFFLLTVALAVLGFLFGTEIISFSGILFFIPTLVFSFVLNFMIFFCVGMWAFWLSEIGFLFEAVRIVIVVLSGGIFPLDIFGPFLGAILKLLPFSYTVNFPVDVLSGIINGVDVIFGLGMQLVWIGLLSGLSALLWRIGSRKYLAAGG